MKLLKILFTSLFLTISYSVVSAIELVIGEEKIKPGIVFIFEGAVKDKIHPSKYNLDEKQTHVHIEARVNWDIEKTPKGAVPGGFVPYLHITSIVINERTGLQTFVDLIPHINLVDNFHYARNISLPGKINDKYTVKFNILKPTHIDLAIHRDWKKSYGKTLMEDVSFEYKNVNFEEIAKATR